MGPEAVPYDTLIVATGSSYSYFGHDEWRSSVAEVKSLEGALRARARILGAHNFVTHGRGARVMSAEVLADGRGRI
jgi:NADH dehydrogenase FAD-containing subunit